jgi:hypothetical protein
VTVMALLKLRIEVLLCALTQSESEPKQRGIPFPALTSLYHLGRFPARDPAVMNRRSAPTPARDGFDLIDDPSAKRFAKNQEIIPSARDGRLGREGGPGWSCE